MKGILDYMDEVSHRLDKIEKLLKEVHPVSRKVPNPERFWSHYCLKELSIIKVEDGCDCNWCGVTEEKLDTYQHTKKYYETERNKKNE
jgi:hypothetical protein